jgi:hypothetical protein
MQGDAGSNILHAVSDIPFFDLTAQSGGDKIMVNMAATGSVLGMLGMGLSHFLDIIGEAFRKKGEVVLANKNVALDRYDHGVSNCARCSFSIIAGAAARPKMLICGIEAIGLGTVASGCKFKFSSDYP